MSLAGGSGPLEQGTGEAKNWDKFKIWPEKQGKKIHWGLYNIKNDNTCSEDCSALIFGVKKNHREVLLCDTIVPVCFPASLLLAIARDRMQGEMDYWSWSGTAIPISPLKQNLAEQQFWVWPKTPHGSIELYQLLGGF